MELRTHPATHIFPALATTATIKCMCGLFHTQFIAENNKTYELNTQTNETTTNKQAKKLQQALAKSKSQVPPSPTATIHTHTCTKCQTLINCKVTNNNHALQNEFIFYQNTAYHNNCLAEIYKEMTLANQPKLQPTENPEQGPSSQYKLPTQQLVTSLLYQNPNNPLVSELVFTLPNFEETTSTNNDMDIDSSTTPPKPQQQPQIQQIQQLQQQQPLHQALPLSHKQQSNKKPLQQP